MSHTSVSVPSQYQADVLGAAKAYNIDPNDLAALLDYESDWDPRARSGAGALGIAQFMPGTANGLRVNPYNTRSAIFGAAKYLDQLGYAKNRLLSFAKYNAGPGNPAAGAGYAAELNHRSKVVSFNGARVTPTSASSVTSSTTSGASSGSGSGWQDWLKRTTLTLTMAGAGLALTGVGIRNVLAQRSKVPA